MPATWKTMPHFAFTLPHQPGEVARFATLLHVYNHLEPLPGA